MIVISSKTVGLSELRDRATINLYPEAAQILGISKSSAYAAAQDGTIPVLRIGRRILVPVPRLLAMLGVVEETSSDVNQAAA